jgi:hypothetical protein
MLKPSLSKMNFIRNEFHMREVGVGGAPCPKGGVKQAAAGLSVATASTLHGTFTTIAAAGVQ